jgi:site-specific recombinase XerD
MTPPRKSITTPPRLLDRVRWHLRVKRYSLRTEQAYLDWIRRFILFHEKRHPADMGEEEIAAFLTHLAVDLKVAASTQNQAFSALFFLYQQVLERKLDFIDHTKHISEPRPAPMRSFRVVSSSSLQPRAFPGAVADLGSR